MANERLLRLKTGAIDETRKLFGIFIYPWVLLSLFSFHKVLVLNDESLIYLEGFAVISALASAKVANLSGGAGTAASGTAAASIDFAAASMTTALDLVAAAWKAQTGNKISIAYA